MQDQPKPLVLTKLTISSSTSSPVPANKEKMNAVQNLACMLHDHNNFTRKNVFPAKKPEENVHSTRSIQV